MTSQYDPLEELYTSETFGGLLRSARSLLKARRVIQRSAIQINFSLSIIYMVPIFIYAVTFEAFQRIRFSLKGLSRKHPISMWDDYLHWGLREDLGNFTNETKGYHQERPEEATSLDDLTAWVMAVMQFVWTYSELLGVIWDEWTLLRLVMEEAQEAELDGFSQLDRQWESQRPYKAPLNGTYADMRREKFDEFYSQALENLPANLQEDVARKYETLSASKRAAFQEQMSVLARVEPNRFRDEKKPIMLWDAHIALVVGGRYHLISLVERDANGAPVAYGIDGSKWALEIREGYAVGKKGERLRLEGDQLLRVRDDKKVGWLDMPSVAWVKWQSRQILGNTDPDDPYVDPSSVDVLLAETPRRAQKGLRKLLATQTQRALENLAYVPVIINWDEQSSERNLAEIRRTNRGIGDHALTIIRTEGTIVFDLSHLFFDGTWSLAVAEVMTNLAIEWCRRIVHITPGSSNCGHNAQSQCLPCVFEGSLLTAPAA